VRDDAEKTLEATLGVHKTSTVATKAENTDSAQNDAAPSRLEPTLVSRTR
jgi:hypothetical protein